MNVLPINSIKIKFWMLISNKNNVNNSWMIKE